MFVCALVMMVSLIVVSKRQKKGLRHTIVQQGRGRHDQGYLWLYRQLSRFLLTRRSVRHIRSRIEILSNANEKSIRLKVMKIYCSILLVLVVLFSLVMVLSKDGWMTLLWVFMIWVVGETLIDFLVVKLGNRLLWQQIKFNETIRHRYYQSGMVDVAIYETCNELGKDHYEIGLQGERMIDVLMSADPEQGMTTYNDLAPNKYLKMFLSLAYMTMEYGDTMVDGVSVFMKNLHDLTNELRIELGKRERLNYALRSLNTIVLLPLVMISPIKHWASTYFMPLQVFYDSQTGFVLEVIIVLLILTCYVLLRKVQQFDQKHAVGRWKEPLEDRLYQGSMKGFLKKLVPRTSSKKYHQLEKQLKRSRATISVEGFVVRQWLCGLCICVCGLVFVLCLHMAAKKQLLTMPTIEATFLGGQLSEDQLAKSMAITERDNHYLSAIDGRTTYAELVDLIGADTSDLDEAKLIASQVRHKQLDFYGHHLKLSELVGILVCGWIAFYLPKLLLLFRRRLLVMEVEDEVAGFSTIVLMLMHHQRLTIIDLLEWFELYSTTFSEAIGDCLNNMSSGMTEALLDLGESSEHEQFSSLVEGLVLASEDITIKQAFDALETEKVYHLEQRKEHNRRLVEKKINLGNMIGFLPVYGLIILYMIVPMVMIGMKDMALYFQQINL